MGFNSGLKGLNAEGVQLFKKLALFPHTHTHTHTQNPNKVLPNTIDAIRVHKMESLVKANGFQFNQ
jgi:hypothetical protein